MMFAVLLLMSLSTFGLLTIMAQDDFIKDIIDYVEAFSYFLLSCDSIFLVCAVSIYLYIFIKIRKNKINQVSLKQLECSNSLDTTQCEIIASNNNTTNDTNNTTNDTNNNNNNKNNTNNNNNSNGNRITKKVKPTKSGLFTPVLLVAPFCLFFIVPDQMYFWAIEIGCLLYTSPSPRDATLSRMPSSA